MEGRIPPREQGDIGERSAAVWLLDTGARVFVPFGHSPDTDLVAEIDGRLVRVQVKTSTVRGKNGRYHVALATKGGNQSWNGLVKRFSASRCDFLFVLVADGRRWFIPSAAVDGGSQIVVGGPKYARYEVERGRAIQTMSDPRSLDCAGLGGVPERSNGLGCKPSGYAFAGSNPAPAIEVTAAPISTVEAALSTTLGGDAPT